MLIPLSLLFMNQPATAAKPLPKATLYADDGDVVKSDTAVHLAVIGNTRPMIRAADLSAGRVGPSKGITERLVGNMGSSEPDAYIMMGDIVTSGRAKAWRKSFSIMPSLNRFPVIPVIGDYDRYNDEDILLWSQVFPEFGADIGLNRISTWYYFDIESKGATWRMIVLDADKSSLGPKWNEQLLWIEEAVKGDYDSLIVMMHPPVFDLSGAKLNMNPEGVPLELVETVEDSIPMLKLRAVISAGGNASHIMLPFNRFGAAFVIAGGGGAPGEDLRMWGSGLDANFPDKVTLEPQFQASILSKMESQDLPSTVMDQAQSGNDFAGLPGLISAKYFPMYGWWDLELNGEEATFSYHHLTLNGTIDSIYSINYSDNEGWEPTIPQ